MDKRVLGALMGMLCGAIATAILTHFELLIWGGVAIGLCTFFGIIISAWMDKDNGKFLDKGTVYLLVSSILFIIQSVFIMYCCNHPESFWPYWIPMGVINIFYTIYFFAVVAFFIKGIGNRYRQE